MVPLETIKHSRLDLGDVQLFMIATCRLRGLLALGRLVDRHVQGPRVLLRASEQSAIVRYRNNAGHTEFLACSNRYVHTEHMGWDSNVLHCVLV